MKAAFSKEACVGVLIASSLLGLGVYTELKDSNAHNATHQNRSFVDGRPIVSTEVIGLSSPKEPQAGQTVHATPAATPHKKRNGAEMLGKIFLAGYFTYIAASIGTAEYKRKRAFGENTPSP
jgi:hypothetical protein